MELFKYGLLFSILFLSQIVSSQVLIGGKESEEKQDSTVNQLKKANWNIDGSTELYFGTNWSRTFRTLEENGELHGSPIGDRGNEIYQNNWSFGLGFRNRVHEHIMIEGGIGFTRNGENYNFTEVDTFYRYQTTYSYITMPIKAYYTYGNDIRFFVGGGIIPQLFLKYKQEQQWETKENIPGINSTTLNTGYNSFVASLVANAGVQFKYSESWSVYVMPELRYQLNSSYTEISAYKHFANAFGVSFGFTYQL
jgi:hypothetical protein